MKKNLMIGLLSSVALLPLMGSCSDDYSPSGSGFGQINPRIDLDGTALQARGSRDASEISVNDLSLKLTSSDGTFTKSWNSVSEFDNTEEFKVGTYTMEASYGALESEGFDSPYYYGTAYVTVLENRVSPVELIAKLANSMVSVEYTDAFKGYFKAYSLQLHSEGGAYIDYAAGETRPAYLRPGKVTVLASVTKPNGVSATLEAASFEAVARHHYTVTIDVNNGNAGDVQMVISFDDSVGKEDIVIDLSDDNILNAPAPEISAEGFDPGTIYEITEGSGAEIAPKFTVVARGGISGVTLTTTSKSLIEQGWPQEVDLTSATAATQAKLKALGLKAMGLFGNVDKLAFIDLTDVLGFIKYRESGNNDTEFTLTVRDKLGKVAGPVKLSLVCQPVVLQLSDPQPIPLGGDKAEFNLVYNGKDVNGKVQFQYMNERGRWDNATIISADIQGRASGSVYKITISIPETEDDIIVRATCGSVVSNELTISHQSFPYILTANDADIFATRAILGVTDEEGKPASLPAGAKIVVSADGVNYTDAEYVVDGNTVILSGLNPATRYTARVFGASKTDLCTFTTEVAAGVPNGDFEILDRELAVTGLNQGGQWSISAGINYQTYVDYTIREPQGWATVNDKTASANATANTWFRVPSTYNTTLYWLTTVPRIKVANTGWDPAVPDVYQNLQAYSGSNAMVVRNVKWDLNGSVPALWRKSFIDKSEYYNHNSANVANSSAGKLFLGSYSFNAADGTESYNEGVTFSSRPSSMKGFYTYATSGADPGEKGKITVTLLNGTTVIGTGEITVPAADNYTEFVVPISYIGNAPKATSLRIMITSSDHASYSQTEENAGIKTDEYLGLWESNYRGATLTVDDLSFTY